MFGRRSFHFDGKAEDAAFLERMVKDQAPVGKRPMREALRIFGAGLQHVRCKAEARDQLMDQFPIRVRSVDRRTLGVFILKEVARHRDLPLMGREADVERINLVVVAALLLDGHGKCEGKLFFMEGATRSAKNRCEARRYAIHRQSKNFLRDIGPAGEDGSQTPRLLGGVTEDGCPPAFFLLLPLLLATRDLAQHLLARALRRP